MSTAEGNPTVADPWEDVERIRDSAESSLFDLGWLNRDHSGPELWQKVREAAWDLQGDANALIQLAEYHLADPPP